MYWLPTQGTHLQRYIQLLYQAQTSPDAMMQRYYYARLKTRSTRKPTSKVQPINYRKANGYHLRNARELSSKNKCKNKQKKNRAKPKNQAQTNASSPLLATGRPRLLAVLRGGGGSRGDNRHWWLPLFLGLILRDRCSSRSDNIDELGGRFSSFILWEWDWAWLASNCRLLARLFSLQKRGSGEIALR